MEEYPNPFSPYSSTRNIQTKARGGLHQYISSSRPRAIKSRHHRRATPPSPKTHRHVREAKAGWEETSILSLTLSSPAITYLFSGITHFGMQLRKWRRGLKKKDLIEFEVWKLMFKHWSFSVTETNRNGKKTSSSSSSIKWVQVWQSKKEKIKTKKEKSTTTNSGYNHGKNRHCRLEITIDIFRDGLENHC